MNIFICGPTGIGKTTLAKELADRLGVSYKSASDWIRKRVDVLAEKAKDESNDEYTQRITQLAIDELAQDPDAALREIRQSLTGKRAPIVIEGIRNPRDFVSLFNPTEDICIFLQNENFLGATAFERVGLKAIEAILTFYSIIDPKLEFYIFSWRESQSATIDSLLLAIGAKQVWKL